MVMNEFINCGGTKGPVLLELVEWSPQYASFIIMKNLFRFCSGIYSSATLHMSSKIRTIYLDSPDLLLGYDHLCGGFFLLENRFEFNSVFSTGGVLRGAC